MLPFTFFMIAGSVAFCLAMSPKVNDGLVIKAGLILVSIGFFGAASASYDDCDLVNSCIAAGVGFLLIIGGIGLRIKSSKFKRITDWLHVEKRHNTRERRVN